MAPALRALTGQAWLIESLPLQESGVPYASAVLAIGADDDLSGN